MPTKQLCAVVLGAAALATFLVATTAAQAGDSQCKPLWDATLARARVAYRSTIDTTAPGRKLLHDQEIHLLDAWYRKFDQHWIRTPSTPQQEIDGITSLNATFSDCRYEGDASLNGEQAAIYHAKTRNNALIPFTGDLKMWISRKLGVPLRTEADASLPILGPSHTVKTYTYGNVQPPSGTVVGPPAAKVGR